MTPVLELLKGVTRHKQAEWALFLPIKAVLQSLWKRVEKGQVRLFAAPPVHPAQACLLAQLHARELDGWRLGLHRTLRELPVAPAHPQTAEPQ